MLLLRVLALSFVLSTSALAAAPKCAQALSADALDRLVAPGDGGARFLRLIREGVLPRVAEDAETIALAGKLHAAPTYPIAKGGRGEAPWVDRWGMAAFQTSDASGIVFKTAGEDRIGYNVFKVVAENTMLGGRPQGLNQTASKVFAALLMALRSDLEQQPTLKEIRIEAGSVVNRDLVTLLKKIGFTREGAVEVDPAVPWDGHHPDYSKTWFVVLPLANP